VSIAGVSSVLPNSPSRLLSGVAICSFSLSHVEGPLKLSPRHPFVSDWSVLFAARINIPLADFFFDPEDAIRFRPRPASSPLPLVGNGFVFYTVLSISGLPSEIFPRLYRDVFRFPCPLATFLFRLLPPRAIFPPTYNFS